MAAVAHNSSKDDAKARAAVHDRIPDQRMRHACSARRLIKRGSPRALAFAGRLRNLRVSSDHRPATSPAGTTSLARLRGPTNSGYVRSLRRRTWNIQPRLLAGSLLSCKKRPPPLSTREQAEAPVKMVLGHQPPSTPSEGPRGTISTLHCRRSSRAMLAALASCEANRITDLNAPRKNFWGNFITTALHRIRADTSLRRDSPKPPLNAQPGVMSSTGGAPSPVTLSVAALNMDSIRSPLGLPPCVIVDVCLLIAVHWSPDGAVQVMADFGQTEFGQTDFGQFWCFNVLTDFGPTDFGQF